MLKTVKSITIDSIAFLTKNVLEIDPYSLFLTMISPNVVVYRYDSLFAISSGELLNPS